LFQKPFADFFTELNFYLMKKPRITPCLTAPCRQGIGTNKKKHFAVNELLFEILSQVHCLLKSFENFIL